VLWDLAVHRPGLTHLHTVMEFLPADLRELVDHTESAVGSVLAAGRR
jgi:hypothetical protein